MFQPGGRGSDAGVLALAPSFGALPLPGRLRFDAAPLAYALARADLCVDLGDRIGSRDWWRGFATLVALAATVWLGGANLTRVPVAVRPALTPAQAEDARPDAIAPLALGAATGRFTAPASLASYATRPPGQARRPSPWRGRSSP